MTKIKICGLTRAEDVEAAIAHGADYLGFIYVPGSPRYVDLDRLDHLLNIANGRAKTVVVVRNLGPDELGFLRDRLDFDLFQFHGSEAPEVVEKWGGYKVIHIKGGAPDDQLLQAYGQPFLLDTQVGSQQGGTGKTFNWSILSSISGEYLVAGGLNPDNVCELVNKHHPWGVDVSSGLESAPGVKDHLKIERFINHVRRPVST